MNGPGNEAKNQMDRGVLACTEIHYLIFFRMSYKLPSVVRQLKTSPEAWSPPYCRTRSVCACMCVWGRKGVEGSVIRKHWGLMVYVFLGSLHLEIPLWSCGQLDKGSWTTGFPGFLWNIPESEESLGLKLWCLLAWSLFGSSHVLAVPQGQHGGN